MSITRAVLIDFLDLCEREPALRERVRRVLGSTVTTSSDDALVGARESGVPNDTWRAACRAGRIEGARLVGRQYRAPRSAVRAWLATLPTARPTLAKAHTAANDDDQGDELDEVLAGAASRRAAL